MSSQLALEILSLSAGLSQFSNFQIVNLGQQNNLLNISPELIQFISSCGACDNRLASLFSSNLNINLLNLNLGQCNGCLQQLVDLQGLFVSGLNLSNSNNTGNANETENANNNNNENDNKNNDEEQAKADEEAKKAEEEAAAKAKEEAAAAEKEGKGKGEGEAAAANETANAANETAVAEGEGEAAANETAVEEEGGEEETPSSEGKKMKSKRGVVVQRSGAGKKVVGAGKGKVLGSAVFGLVMVGLVCGL
ncbi:hypothetical protein DL95DRAFT_458555 [Leptodontidium sp. 2 PMI_412]|nr:hypothetical protein DL95DRAFT_458555 [Leptodontidium sp. 2 PMI_412]